MTVSDAKSAVIEDQPDQKEKVKPPVSRDKRVKKSVLIIDRLADRIITIGGKAS